MREQRQTSSGSPCWTLNVFNQTTKTISFGITYSYRRIEDLDDFIEQLHLTRAFSGVLSPPAPGVAGLRIPGHR